MSYFQCSLVHKHEALAFLLPATVASLCSLLSGCGQSTTQFEEGSRFWMAEFDSSGFSEAKSPVQLEFPRDHGAHPTFGLEWWYLNAILTTAAGREFGVQFTLFRLATTPDPEPDNPWRTGQLFNGHVALSDVSVRKHHEAERISRGHPDLAGVTVEPFKAFIDGWTLQSIGSEFTPIRLMSTAKTFSIDLVFDLGKPIFFHGNNGLSRKTPEASSYYYSLPRMEASGHLIVDGEEYEVQGKGWMDREWSSEFLGKRYSGWDWFALQFDDGRDLVIFQIRPKNSATARERTAVVIGNDGQGNYLSQDEWDLSPVRTWKGFPVEWKLRVLDQSSTIVAAFENQRMDTSVDYWEGVVYVVSPKRRIGKGYMELVGY